MFNETDNSCTVLEQKTGKLTNDLQKKKSLPALIKSASWLPLVGKGPCEGKGGFYYQIIYFSFLTTTQVILHFHEKYSKKPLHNQMLFELVSNSSKLEAKKKNHRGQKT